MSRGERRLTALAEAGRALGAVHNGQQLVETASRWGLQVVEADTASMSVLDRAHGWLRTVFNAGALAPWEEERPADEVYPLVQYPQASRLLEEGRSWYGSLEDPDLPLEERRLLEALGKHSALGLSVLLGDAVWGELYLTRTADRPVFAADDVVAGEAFAGLVSAALSHLEARDALHTMAYRDPLTGLGNRRVVDEQLEDIFAYHRLERPVALILADVDDLKVINDRYGHGAGDRVLRDVASLLSVEVSRLPDAVAARIGGDEFCLILQGATREQVVAVIERLSAGAEAVTLCGGLSCGFAIATERPGDAPSAAAAARALLRLADAAQYRAKRQGRRVAVNASAEPAPTSAGAAGATLVARALERMAGLLDPLDRLVAIGVTAAEVLDVAAWWVSTQAGDGPITVHQHGYARAVDLDPATAAPRAGIEFDVDKYPATRAALAGGSFQATVDAGDWAEREYLAAYGYAEIVGAGTPDGDTRWLVELCGDALGVPLAPHEGALRALVEVAVHGHAGTVPVPAGSYPPLSAPTATS